jgi:hypothetical protein
MSGVVFVLGVSFLGFAAGGFVGGRLLGSGGTGFDALADVLGGVTIGTAVALIAALFLVRSLSTRARLLVGLTAILSGAALLLVLQANPAGRPVTMAPAPSQPAFEAAFVMSIEAPEGMRLTAQWRCRGKARSCGRWTGR